MAWGRTEKSVPANALDLSGMAGLEDAREFLRMWAGGGGPVTCFIDVQPVGADPAGFGIAMVDAVRHAAKAYAQAVGIAEQDALARIWEGFDTERGTPTDAPTQLNDQGLSNDGVEGSSLRPGQHFDLAALGIDAATTDEAVRILKDGKRWAFIVDPDIVGPPQVLAQLCIDLMNKGAKIYAKQQDRHEAEVLMEILVSLDHYLQQPDERSH